MIKQSLKVDTSLFRERRLIQCPKCHVGMSLTTVTGIAVEKCPMCEGTFFDKGEVESLIRKNLRFARLKPLRVIRWT